MSLRVHAATIMVVVALGGPAPAQPAQPAKPEVAVHKLRNIAAADAANALTVFIEKKKLPVTIVAEPLSNSVMLAGDVASLRKLAELLTTLDKQPTLIHTQLTILEVPTGFVEDIGLGEKGEANWVLTPREVRMLKAAIGLGKERPGLNILSRPQLLVADNTTGAVQIVANDADSQTARITPRIVNDGTVHLRVETEFKRTTQGKVDVETVEATWKVANGGTLVMRGGRTKTADGDTRETLVIMTVNVVLTESK